MPVIGRMKPGRNRVAVSGRRSKACSVRPFTGAHKERPFPELTVPEPETSRGDIKEGHARQEATEQRAGGQREAPGDGGIFDFLQPAGGDAEAEKHASRPLRSVSIPASSSRSRQWSLRSSASSIPLAVRTPLRVGWRRHCPTVAPRSVRKDVRCPLLALTSLVDWLVDSTGPHFSSIKAWN